MRVGADQRVGHGDGLSIGGSAVDDCCQVFEIDLVHDAAAGRHDTEVLEGFLRPAQQGVALQVALVLASDVHLERVGAAEVINLDRVVDDQIARDEWIDALRITPETRHCGPHGGQVDRGGHAREVLQEHTCRVERELALLMVRRMPACQMFDLTSPHDAIASIAQQVLQQHFDRHRQPLDTGVAVFGQIVEAVVRDRAGRGLQRRASSFKRFGGRLPGAHGLSLPQGSAIAYIVAPRRTAARGIGTAVAHVANEIGPDSAAPRENEAVRPYLPMCWKSSLPGDIGLNTPTVEAEDSECSPPSNRLRHARLSPQRVKRHRAWSSSRASLRTVGGHP